MLFLDPVAIKGTDGVSFKFICLNRWADHYDSNANNVHVEHWHLIRNGFMNWSGHLILWAVKPCFSAWYKILSSGSYFFPFFHGVELHAEAPRAAGRRTAWTKIAHLPRQENCGWARTALGVSASLEDMSLWVAIFKCLWVHLSLY